MTKNLCNNCVHWIEGIYCEAFPEGIPPEILEGDDNHSKPWPSQVVPLVFKAKPKDSYP